MSFEESPRLDIRPTLSHSFGFGYLAYLLFTLAFATQYYGYVSRRSAQQSIERTLRHIGILWFSPIASLRVYSLSAIPWRYALRDLQGPRLPIVSRHSHAPDTAIPLWIFLDTAATPNGHAAPPQ